MKDYKKIAAAVLCTSMLFGIASCSKSDGTSGKHRDDGRETVEDSKREGVEDVVETETSETDSRPQASAPNTTFETGADFTPDFTFSTTDRVGNVWDESVFANAEITMINFFEPWCSPCVGEMPDLEKLYENYKDQGFQIIGVYSDTTMEYNVDQILKDCNTTYPILLYTSEFDQFDSGYVPTTIFVDSKGHVVRAYGNEELIVGSKTYEEWEAIVKKFLG